MVAVVILGLLFAISFFLRKYRRETVADFTDRKSIYRFFYPVALYFHDKFIKKHLGNDRERRIRLKSVGETNYDEYISKRGSQAILMLVMVCIVSVFFELSYKRNRLEGVLLRPGVNEEETVYHLKVNDGKNSYMVDATVSPVRLSEEQVFKLMEKGYEELKEKILAENISLSEIKNSLYLPSSCVDGVIKVDWGSSDTEVVDTYGNVNNRDLENDCEVTLTAVLSYGDYEMEYNISLIVKPYIYSEYEVMNKKIEDALEQADKKSDGDVLELPREIDGRKVKYSNGEKNYSVIVMILGVFACVIFLLLPDTSLRKKLNERNMQMRIDYSEIVSKTALLLGCGMTLRKAWEKIVADYRKDGKHRFAYEEMALTHERIETGFSPMSEYEDFGKRCNLKEYKRFVSILTQNMRKGNEGLLQKLNYEVEISFDARKRLARVLGEEASTKLLIPMIMMLVIVIGIVVIPIFLNL